MGQNQIGDVQHLCLRMQSKFAESMVHEFGANEKTLEDIDVKAAPNSNGKFFKSDVTAENATLPDETPVLQYSRNVHS